jgi:hypothetical protein
MEELYAGTNILDQFADIGTVLETAADDLEPEVHSMRHVFDGARRPVFIDSIHTNEQGARLVAEAMYRELLPTLRDRAR